MRVEVMMATMSQQASLELLRGFIKYEVHGQPMPVLSDARYQPDDKTLLKDIKGDDPWKRELAYAYIYNATREAVAAIVRKNLNDADLYSTELAQDVFAELTYVLLKRLSDVEYVGKPIRNWVTKTAKWEVKRLVNKKRYESSVNLSLDEDSNASSYVYWQLYRIQGEPVSDNNFAEANPESLTDEEQQRADEHYEDLVRRSRLTRKERLVTDMFYYSDSTLDDIKEALGMRDGYMRTMASRIKKKLQFDSGDIPEHEDCKDEHKTP
jgi:RNA polymerase sigma factor (sigma-70 family)